MQWKTNKRGLLRLSTEHRVTGNQRRVSILSELGKQKFLQIFVISGMLFLFIFSYLPMTGLIMAFKNYTITMGIKGIFTSEWVGLKYFQEFITDYKFWPLVRNTIALSCFKLIFAFPMPILFAIMLNEVKHNKFKRFVQTASYMPHFISWVIISGLAVNFLSIDRGAINSIFLAAGFIKEPIPFLSSADYFWGIAVCTDIWKDMGWWAILFLAAITGIDLSLYEAADIDGASRLSKI